MISWIFHSEINPILGDNLQLENWSSGLLALCHYMQENRQFYLDVLGFQGQNSFVECLMDFYQNMMQNLLQN